MLILCITVTYSKVISIARIKGHANAIDELFNALDLENTGFLTRMDVQAFMKISAEHTKLDVQDVNSSVIEAAVDALIHDASSGDGSDAEGGDEGEDLITREQFHDIFNRHPDMLVVFEDESASTERRENVLSARDTMDEGGEEEEEKENEQVWVHDLLTHWKNRWIASLWIGLYLAANVTVFTLKAIKYSRNEEAMALFGNCIVVARGCASALNLNACLVLLVMCKHVLTLARKTPLRFVIPFDAMQEAHIMIGIVFALLAASHTR